MKLVITVLSLVSISLSTYALESKKLVSTLDLDCDVSWAAHGDKEIITLVAATGLQDLYSKTVTFSSGGAVSVNRTVKISADSFNGLTLETSSKGLRFSANVKDINQVVKLEIRSTKNTIAAQEDDRENFSISCAQKQ